MSAEHPPANVVPTADAGGADSRADPAGIDSRADPASLDWRAVRRAFSRAAATYDAAAVLQREVGARMAERLDVVKLAPTALLDAGCGTGDALALLATRYPGACRVALDLALPMLDAARIRSGPPPTQLARLIGMVRGAGRQSPTPAYVCADIGALPFATGVFDLV